MKKRLKIWQKILIGVFILIILLLGIGIAGFVWIGNQFYDGSTRISSKEVSIKNSETFLTEVGLDKTAFLKKYNGEAFTLGATQHKHTISGTWLSKGNTKKRPTVVMVHGMGGDHTTVYPIATIFLDRGYNVVAYDQRNSGNNTADRNGFMYLESDDLADVVAMVQKENGMQPVILWGTSYGGGTVAIGLGKHNLQNTVSGVILDCPFSSMVYTIRLEIADVGMDEQSEAFAMSVGSLMTKIRMGFGYEETEAADYVKEADLPVLIFNSRSDTVTPPFMAQDIYKALPEGQKKLVTVEDSEHIKIFDDHRDLYIQSVEQLLNDIK